MFDPARRRHHPIEAAQIACGIAPDCCAASPSSDSPPFRDHLLPRGSPASGLPSSANIRHAFPSTPGDVAFRMTDFATCPAYAQRRRFSHAIEFQNRRCPQRGVRARHHDVQPALRRAYRPKAPSSNDTADTTKAKTCQLSGRAEQFQTASQRLLLRLSAHWKRRFAGWTAWVLTRHEAPRRHASQKKADASSCSTGPSDAACSALTSPQAVTKNRLSGRPNRIDPRHPGRR